MPPPAVPRIVFFGPPNAGKTALLSAFLRVAKAAETVPLTPAEATPRDVVPHVVHPDAPAGVVLIDTDGKTAAKLIADPGRFRPRPVRREPASVTAAVYAADALVLLIDASADDVELDLLFRAVGADFVVDVDPGLLGGLDEVVLFALGHRQTTPGKGQAGGKVAGRAAPLFPPWNR